MNSKEIRAKISALLMEQRTIALAGFTPESRNKFDKIQKDVEALEADATRVDAMEAREREGRSFERSPRPGAGSGSYSSHDEQVRDEFRNFLRTGRVERRDLLTTSDATGGAIIPQLWSGELVDALKFYGPIASKVQLKITRNNGSPMKVSFDSDVANSLTLLGTEGSTSPAETDPTFKSVIIGTDLVTTGLIKVSVQELEDSAFDLDSFIRTKFGIRYARGVERIITLGVDSAGTALPNQPTGGLLAQAPVSNTTAAIADGIGWDDLTTLATSGVVDQAYTIGASFVMSPATRGYLVGLKDGYGRPFFTPDPSADAPFDKLMGYPIVLNSAMPSPTAGAYAANSLPILFGNLSEAFMLRIDGEPNIVHLKERYMDTLEHGYFGYVRIAGLYKGQTGVNPIAALKIAAN